MEMMNNAFEGADQYQKMMDTIEGRVSSKEMAELRKALESREQPLQESKPMLLELGNSLNRQERRKLQRIEAKAARKAKV